MTAMDDNTLSEIMQNARLIAAVGVSGDPDRASYEVAAYQQSQGYKVVPVNPREDSILGHKALASIEDVTEPIDIVNIFNHGEAADQAIAAAVRSGAKVLWLQPGVHRPATEAEARFAGMTVVTDRCFRREHQRLLADKPM